ncbi:response regulator [Neptunicoccus sediminis]|uniref:response regulator n=1 Tax=Neptunicoccus sediminis TaxID=1892596 RepID=UPI000845FF02|nr:response regulator [Neptunicoccus sediminis]
MKPDTIAQEENRIPTDLERFEEASSEAGLMRRYVRGRIAALPIRLILAVVGCTLISALISPYYALLVAVVVFPLEMLEYMILARVRQREDFVGFGVSCRVTLVSLLQVSGLGAGMVMAGTYSESLRMFSWAYLFGAIMNSLLMARFHPPSHKVRLYVLGLAGAIILAHAFLDHSAKVEAIASEMAAVASMILIVAYLFSHLAHRGDRNRAAERALILKSEEAGRLALVAEHASDSIVLMNPNREVTWVNSRFTALTGYTGKEVIGRNIGELLNHPKTDLGVVNEMVQKVSSGTPATARIRNRTKTGRAFWMETHQTPFFHDDGTIAGYIAVERDVTDTVRQERDLRDALAKAEKAAAAKTEFLSRMSHELRTPANGLCGGVELLKDTQLQADQVDAFSILDSSTKRLAGLVDNITIVADMEAGKLKPTPRPFMIDAVLEQVTDAYRQEIDEKALDLGVEIAPAARQPLTADPDILQRILCRLICNCVKFTNKGGIYITVAVDKAAALIVTIKDTGVGIEPANLTRIFDSFEQQDSAMTRPFDGAGLGLSSARDLARLIGADIRIKSAPDAGCTVTLSLPLEPAAKGIDGTAETTPHAGQKETGRKRLLVAEDNSTNRLLIKTMLKNAGHALEFADDGVQAVERYSRNRYDCILMDISMPNKNGLDATRDIRAIESDKGLRRCPIVAVTANTSGEDRRRCAAAGMDGFLAKPLTKERLLDTIGHIGMDATDKPVITH